MSMMRWRAPWRALGALVVGGTLAAGLVGLQASPAAAVVQLTPFRMWAPNTAYSGNADTAQKINTIVKNGPILYIGGSFTRIRPEPGPNNTLDDPTLTVAQPNLYAVDTRTGAYVPWFRPQVNGIVEALEVDPVTDTLFVGGRFTQVNGQNITGFAILDATTGALKSGVTQLPINKAGGANPRVMGLKRVGRQLYVGGDFVNIGTSQRGNLARINIDNNFSVDAFSANIAGLVRTMDVDPANPSRIYIGGEFNGVRLTPGGPVVPGTRWLAALLTANGQPDTAFIPNVPCDTDPNCTNPTRGRRVVARNERVYVAFGGGWGRMGIFNQANGATIRMIRTDGDVHTVTLVGDRVYVGGHFTELTNLGNPRPQRCQLFAIGAMATSGPPLADPVIVNGSHLGVFEMVHDTNGDVYVAGHLVSPTPAGPPACDAGSSNGTFNHIIRLRDGGGPVDNTPPTVPNVNVSPGLFTSANVSWSSTDANGVSAYRLYINGQRVETLSGLQTSKVLNNLQPDTTYTVQLEALDAYGNRSALSAPRTFRTGTALPNPLNAFGQFFPTPQPTRILDTRMGIGAPGRVVAGTPTRFRVTGVGGVPATGVQSVVLNVTVTEPTMGGFVTVYPTGEAPPTASNLNFTAGQTVPNLVQARVGAGGTVEAIVNAGSTHLVADVVGWYATNAETRPGSRIEPQAPVRVLDTRPGSRVGPYGAVGPGQTIEVQVLPPGQGYTGVVLNLTGTEPTSSTYVTAYPGHLAQRPVASNLNLRPGETRPNLVMVGVSPQGTVKLFNFQGTTHLVVDVVGRYRGTTSLDNNPAGRILSLPNPIRMVDTRVNPGEAAPAGTRTWSFASLEAALPPGVGVQGLVMNATATEATASTFLTIYPSDSPRPTASNLNVRPGQNVPNLAMARLSATETLDVYNLAGRVHYIFDVSAVVLG